MQSDANQTGSRNRFYRIGFFTILTLFTVLILTIVIIVSRLFAEGESHSLPPATSDGNLAELVTFQLDREQTNVLLTDLVSEDEMPFQFQLEEDGIHLTGELDVLFSEVDIHMMFDPLVRDDGSLVLQANSLSAGVVSISASNALRMFNQFAELPEWIHIHPEDEAILLELNEMDELSPYGLQFKQVALADDQIELSLIRKETATEN